MTIDTQLTIARNAFGAGDLLTAQGAWIAALREDQDCFEAMANMATLLLKSGREPAAIIAGERAVKLKPDSVEAWNNLGYIYGVSGDFEQCERALRACLDLKPDYFTAWHHLGLCLTMRGKFTEAVAAFDQALTIQPGDVEAADKRGIALLGAGKYIQGLIDNKIRWHVLVAHPMMRAGIPEWGGEPLDGKTIMVLHEQGMGDTFQFVRFVPLLKERGAYVVISAPDQLHTILRDSNLANEVVGIRDLPASGKADYVCPMLTVPAYVNIRMDALPPCPYLIAKTDKSPVIFDRRKFKVGLVWAGKPMYAQDRWRSMALENLLPLFAQDNVSFYSLQMDERKKDLWQTGAGAFVTDLSPHISDWADTASIISELDLLVSVDTAPAHVAGAMGKPVALMIPQASCWRWHAHGTTRTAWYPSMHLFRQQRQGDWTPVVATIGDLIRARAAAH